MNNSSEKITLEIIEPAGIHHQVNVPPTANVQHFCDVLVAKLNLPVIDNAGHGIIYHLVNQTNGQPLPLGEDIGTLDHASPITLRLIAETPGAIAATDIRISPTFAPQTETINLLVEYSGGLMRSLRVETGTTVQALITSLLQQLGLPSSDEEIGYRLQRSDGSLLQPALTVAEQSLSSGERLDLLLPNELAVMPPPPPAVVEPDKVDPPPQASVTQSSQRRNQVAEPQPPPPPAPPEAKLERTAAITVLVEYSAGLVRILHVSPTSLISEIIEKMAQQLNLDRDALPQYQLVEATGRSLNPDTTINESQLTSGARLTLHGPGVSTIANAPLNPATTALLDQITLFEPTEVQDE